MRYPGFIGGSEVSQSVIADGEDTINWYLEALPPNAKNKYALYPTPGQRAFLTVTNIGGRALFSMNDRTFAVMGPTLYELFSSATSTNRGTVAQDNNPATISYNGPTGGQLFITSGGNGYIFTLATNVLTQVLTGDATMGGMLDGYFIAFAATTSRIRLSNLNDGATWDPTQFAARNAAPDPWKAMVVASQPPGVWLIGEQSGEVWYDAGTSFPLAPIPGASFRFGTPAPFSVGVAGDRVSWLSQNAEGAGIIVAARGYTPVPISSPAVQAAISSYGLTSTIADAELFSYQDQGHSFSVFTFPRAKASWAFDTTTEVWAKRGTWDTATGQFDYWHPRVHCYAFGKHLVADRSTNSINSMDVSFGSEADGSAIRRVRVAPGLFNEHRQMLIRRLEVYLEAGLGLISGQGSNPIVMWRTSDDGGKTWGRQRMESAGRMGEYSKRVIFTRMGISRDRVNEMTVSDPIPWRIVDAYINNDGASGGQ